MPSFTSEIAAGLKNGKIICGIDEAGRGPLAGPVVAAAAIVTKENCPQKIRRKIDDSKKLSPLEREEIALELQARIPYAVGIATVMEIDQFNILRATFLAMRRAFGALEFKPDAALIDGNQHPGIEGIDVRMIIEGDSKSFSIAAASIIAKTHRDKIMRELSSIYTGYGWETNMGYGTPAHLAALRSIGPCIEHRQSFRPIYQYSLLGN